MEGGAEENQNSSEETALKKVGATPAGNAGWLFCKNILR